MECRLDSGKVEVLDDGFTKCTGREALQSSFLTCAFVEPWSVVGSSSILFVGFDLVSILNHCKLVSFVKFEFVETIALAVDIVDINVGCVAVKGVQKLDALVRRVLPLKVFKSAVVLFEFVAKSHIVESMPESHFNIGRSRVILPVCYSVSDYVAF